MARGVSRSMGARSVRLMELDRLAKAQLRMVEEMRGRGGAGEAAPRLTRLSTSAAREAAKGMRIAGILRDATGFTGAGREKAAERFVMPVDRGRWLFPGYEQTFHVREKGAFDRGIGPSDQKKGLRDGLLAMVSDGDVMKGAPVTREGVGARIEFLKDNIQALLARSDLPDRQDLLDIAENLILIREEFNRDADLRATAEMLGDAEEDFAGFRDRLKNGDPDMPEMPPARPDLPDHSPQQDTPPPQDPHPTRQTLTPANRGRAVEGEGIEGIPYSVGDKFFHRRYGPVTVAEVGTIDGMLWLKFSSDTGKTIEAGYDTNDCLPVDSPEIKTIIEKRWKDFPILVGMAYVLQFITRYEPIVGRNRRGFDQDNFYLFVNVATHYMNRGPYPQFWLQQFGVDGTEFPEDEKPFLGKDKAVEILKKIYLTSGDDVVSLGFRYFGSDLIALIKLIHNNRVRGSYSVGADNFGTALWRGVLTHYQPLRREVDIRSMLSAAEVEGGLRQFAVGDLDIDRTRYNALLAGDRDALDFWTKRVRRFIADDPRLADVDRVVTVPVEGSVNWPYETLASRVVPYGMEAVSHLFNTREGFERPNDTFWEREWCPMNLYGLTQRRSVDIKDKKVIVLVPERDDHLARAIGGKLRRLGARDVYFVSLVQKNRRSLRLTEGGTVYHAAYGPVEIVSTEDKGEDGLWWSFRYGSEVITQPFNPEQVFHMDDPRVTPLFGAAVEDRYRYLPEAVGFVYLTRHKDRYGGLVDSALSIDGRIRYHIGLAVGQYLMRRRWDGMHTDGSHLRFGVIPAELRGEHERRRDEDVEHGRAPFHLWGPLTHVFREIYRLRGDDLIELGFRRYRGSMGRLVQDAGLWEQGEGEVERRRGAVRARLSGARDDVMLHYFHRMDDVGVVTGLAAEEREVGRHLFAAGDYRRDEGMYDALRAGGEDTKRGIEHWTPRIAELFEGDERLMRTDLIVPVLGREVQGWPVAQLAESVGRELGIEVRRDLWQPRPPTVKASESRMSFAKKEDQAARAHRLLRRTMWEKERIDPEIRAAVEGKVVVVFDDMWHTGATARAAAYELRAAGAREVYIVVATRTNKRDDLGD